MKTPGIESLQRALFLLCMLAVPCGSVWAASANCVYGKSAGTGMGGTGMVAGGTGMGGTGAVARGTGMGGTGISPEPGKSAMQLAGNVIFSEGAVEAQRDGKSRLLAKGDPVCVGETIVTAQSGHVQIKMADEALVAIRPLTQLKIEKYTYAGNSKDGSLLALLQGACRMVTGKIGKAYPQNDLIQTPTATIGVRGTDHEATVILPGDSRGYAAGTYDKVNSGITFIRTERGEVDIHPAQVGFAASAVDLPNLLKEMPGFYQASSPPLQEGASSEAEDRKAGVEHGEKADHSPEAGSRAEHPAEAGMPAIEHPEVQKGVEVPELPERPELPELPELPDLMDRSEQQ